MSEKFFETTTTPIGEVQDYLSLWPDDVKKYMVDYTKRNFFLRDHSVIERLVIPHSSSSINPFVTRNVPYYKQVGPSCGYYALLNGLVSKSSHVHLDWFTERIKATNLKNKGVSNDELVQEVNNANLGIHLEESYLLNEPDQYGPYIINGKNWTDTFEHLYENTTSSYQTLANLRTQFIRAIIKENITNSKFFIFSLSNNSPYMMHRGSDPNEIFTGHMIAATGYRTKNGHFDLAVIDSSARAVRQWVPIEIFMTEIPAIFKVQTPPIQEI